MSNMTELQRAMMQALFDEHGDDEMAVCDAYADAERAGKVARPEEWHIGKAEGWLLSAS